MKSSKPDAGKIATRLMASLPKLSAEIEVPAGMNTLAPACTSLTVPPKCTRVVPFCKKEDFVGLGRPVGVDFLSYWNACRKQDQLRGSSILQVDLENEGLPRIGMPRPSPHHAALAFVFLKESAESAWLR